MSFSHRRCIFPRGVEWHNSLEHTSIYLPLSASVLLSLCLPLYYSASLLLCLCLPLFYSASVNLITTRSLLPLSYIFCLSASLLLCLSITLLLCLCLPLCYSASVCLCLPLCYSASFCLSANLPLSAVNVHLPSVCSECATAFCLQLMCTCLCITDHTHLPCTVVLVSYSI